MSLMSQATTGTRLRVCGGRVELSRRAIRDAAPDGQAAALVAVYIRHGRRAERRSVVTMDPNAEGVVV